MKRLLFSLSLCCAGLTAAADIPLWLRDAMISPTGDAIAFCYKGDIYKVGVGGGTAQRLTTTASYEAVPVWSNDGKKIAFVSDRQGGADIYIMSADGGAATRLTTHSTSEVPMAFSTDDQFVYFSASIQDPARSALFPKSVMTEVYKVPVTGGRVQQLLATPAEMISLNKQGDKWLYQDRKGGENEWRKHHTSSITRDIWLYDVKTKQHRNLTNVAGEDRNPVFSPDGQTVYFLSERNGGTFNLYSFPLSQPSQVRSLTNFHTHPLRFLSISRNGTLCYTYDGEIYTQTAQGKPQKVRIDIVRDDAENTARFSFSRGAREAAISPDGKQVAVVVRGNVFATTSDYSTTKQITDTPEAEAGVTFSPDGRTLAYASERNGNWGLYTTAIVRKEDLNFANATQLKEEELIPLAGVERAYPQFSPDGKELAFIEDRRKLRVVNLATKAVRTITDGTQWHSTAGGFTYAWSPDGRWFALEFIGNKHDPYTDVGIVSADGEGKIINITNSGYFSNAPRWVMKGNALLFNSDKYGMRNHASWGSMEDAFLVFMNKDAYDKFRLNKEDYELLKELEKEQEKEKKDAEKDKKKSNDKTEKKAEDKKRIVVELDGITDRIVRLTPNSSDLASAIITDDGEKMYYLSSFEGGYDMWRTDLRKRETKLLHKMNGSWANLALDKEGKTVFLLGSSIQKMDVAGEKLKNIAYLAEMKMDLMAERAYEFEHVYRQQKKRFYRTDMHGVDWEGLTRAYRKFLPHINNDYDFAEMLSEYLGELNVSHTGSGFRGPRAEEATAELGLLYDWNYTGKGLRISEVLAGSPFDRHSSNVKAGDIITAINGTEILPTTDVYALLNGQTGKKTLISLKDAKGKAWDEVVKPISAGAQSDLLYERWVKARAADVERWSNGRLGYVHIASMNDESFRRMYSDVLGKYNHCDGIVIDTRFNGGGRLHEDIEVFFSGDKYFTQVIRGVEACDMPSRRWNKPSIMVQNEANYSNAHGTPWVYKHKGIGKLVGAPVPGTMTSVSWETLQNPSLYFGIPIIGYRLPDGGYTENLELQPDVYVLNTPEKIVEGEDTQLRTAVNELLKEIKR